MKIIINYLLPTKISNEKLLKKYQNYLLSKNINEKYKIIY